MNTLFLAGLRFELKKALTNRWFLLCLVVGLICVVLVALDTIPRSVEQLERCFRFSKTNADSPGLFSSYAQNLLTAGESGPKWLFFILAPLMALMAYSWSHASEAREGVAQQLIVQTGRVRYYAAKYIATFIAAGLVVAIPLSVSFILTSCFLPAYKPDNFEYMHVFVDQSCILGDWYFGYPLAYMVGRIGLDFVFCGLWAVFVLSISLVVKNRILLMVIPYLALYAVKAVGERLYVIFEVHGPSMTLFDQLKGMPDACFNWHWVTTLEMVLLCAAGIALSAWLVRRDVL